MAVEKSRENLHNTTCFNCCRVTPYIVVPSSAKSFCSICDAFARYNDKCLIENERRRKYD